MGMFKNILVRAHLVTKRPWTNSMSSINPCCGSTAS